MARTYRKPGERAIERLTELARLEHDWDSYGADPPAPRAISMATAMVERTAGRFDESGIPREIMPIADGGIQLEWRDTVGELALNAAPDGTWSSLLVQHGPEGRTFEEAYGLTDADVLALALRVLGTR